MLLYFCHTIDPNGIQTYLKGVRHLTLLSVSWCLDKSRPTDLSNPILATNLKDVSRF